MTPDQLSHTGRGQIILFLQAPRGAVHMQKQRVPLFCMRGVFCSQLAALGSAGAPRAGRLRDTGKRNAKLLCSPLLLSPSTFHQILLYRLKMLANKRLWAALLNPTSAGQNINITSFLRVFGKHCWGTECRASASICAVKGSPVSWGQWNNR